MLLKGADKRHRCTNKSSARLINAPIKFIKALCIMVTRYAMHHEHRLFPIVLRSAAIGLRSAVISTRSQ
jgi:hypothetical protein